MESDLCHLIIVLLERNNTWVLIHEMKTICSLHIQSTLSKTDTFGDRH